MRILFFGTSEFAAPSLIALAEAPNRDVLAVVTQPDRPSGRGLQLAQSPVKKVALALGLRVIQPKRVRREEFLAEAQALQPDVLALAAFGQIIPQALLDLPPLGPVNVHGSLLPAYRGAAPIQHAILNGETVTGVTTMWMDASLDTGDILLRRELPIDPEDTTGALTPRMAQAGADLLLETLNRLEAGNCPRVPQDSALATYAPAITPADSVMDWGESAERIRNRIRALSPRPGAYTEHYGRRIKLWHASLLPDSPPTAPPGEVIAITSGGVEVATGNGTLLLDEVQPENSRRMTAAEWARGARLSPGVRLLA